MATVIVIGVEGEKNLWIADLDAGTIVPLDAPGDGALGKANELRQSGAAVIKGVNLAVSVRSSAAVSSGYLDG